MRDTAVMTEATFVLPPRKSLADFMQDVPAGARAKQANFAAASVAETSPRSAPRKGQAWTEQEHLAFLAGLKKLGKGNWRGIAKYYVPSRSSTQIASHAQKYLQRIGSTKKRRSKFSEIERKVHSAQLADEFQPVWPLPESIEGSPRAANSAPAGMEGVEEAEGAEAGTVVDSLQPVCKPTAVKASSSEPDLLRLAESLISLSDPSRAFSSSQQSAFRSPA